MIRSPLRRSIVLLAAAMVLWAPTVAAGHTPAPDHRPRPTQNPPVSVPFTRIVGVLEGPSYIQIPAGAVLELRLVDAAPAGRPTVALLSRPITRNVRLPLDFGFDVDAQTLGGATQPELSARILRGEQVLLTSTTAVAYLPARRQRLPMRVR